MKSLYKIRPIGIVLLLLPLFSTFSGCRKYVEIDAPVTSVRAESVYANDESAIAVMTGMYAQLSQEERNLDPLSSLASFSIAGAACADDLTMYSVNNNIGVCYLNNLRPTQGNGILGGTYPLIYTCNTVIEHLTDNSKLTPFVQKKLMGEAKFMRAFFYFYLVNLYGDIPLVLSTDPEINAKLSRTGTENVYQQIIQDLSEAKVLLGEEFLDGKLSAGRERVRPTKWAAAALLARVYLFHKDYDKAILSSSEVIDQTNRFGLPELQDVFLKNSSESIWQLQNVSRTGANTGEAHLFALISAPSDDQPAYLSNSVYNSFEPNDQRKLKWIDSVRLGNTTYPFPYKYRADRLTSRDDSREYFMVLRLAEQYLIRAEAEVYKNQISGAQDDLNKIRRRAGLVNTAVSSPTYLLDLILHERQVELFTEWGHRWLDLKRTGKINDIMPSVCNLKGTVWESYKQYFPLGNDLLKQAPNLTQTPGY